VWAIFKRGGVLAFWKKMDNLTQPIMDSAPKMTFTGLPHKGKKAELA